MVSTSVLNVIGEDIRTVTNSTTSLAIAFYATVVGSGFYLFETTKTIECSNPANRTYTEGITK